MTAMGQRAKIQFGLFAIMALLASSLLCGCFSQRLAVAVDVPEDGILAARAELARQGFYVEHTTAANYAALDEIRRQYGPIDDILITLCGAGLKSDH